MEREVVDLARKNRVKIQDFNLVWCS
uniref:Uncharacterized protein n=1 Tax=Rhizophora mucronata TaxID=61149 RepID=A0A2P2PTW1_RHIMU